MMAWLAGSVSVFDLIFETNLDQAGMQEAAIRFSREARSADVALFYYSGHALQYAGVNYLVPVDAVLRDEADLRRMARADIIDLDHGGVPDRIEDTVKKATSADRCPYGCLKRHTLSPFGCGSELLHELEVQFVLGLRDSA